MGQYLEIIQRKHDRGKISKKKYIQYMASLTLWSLQRDWASTFEKWDEDPASWWLSDDEREDD